jgi:hypothetical protein
MIPQMRLHARWYPRLRWRDRESIRLTYPEEVHRTHLPIAISGLWWKA